MDSCNEEVQQSGLEERRELINQFRGQTIRIPDLHSLLHAWPEATNSQISALRIDVDQTLNSFFLPGRRRSELKTADPALFGAMSWPYASFERLCVATYLSIWVSFVPQAPSVQLDLHLISDREALRQGRRCIIQPQSLGLRSLLRLKQCTESDSLEFSELATNYEEAQAFRAITVNRIRTSLALDCTASNRDTITTQMGSRDSILEQFAPVGCAIIKHCTLGKCLLNINKLVIKIFFNRATQCSNAAA